MNDIELEALTEIVRAETDMMRFANEDRMREGYALAYPNCGDYWNVLRDELLKRGIVTA